jgi:hypothetical protein
MIKKFLKGAIRAKLGGKLLSSGFSAEFYGASPHTPPKNLLQKVLWNLQKPKKKIS